MKVKEMAELSLLRHKCPRPTPKKQFKEVYKAKEKPKEVPPAAVFQPSPFEIRPELNIEKELLEMVDLIQTHIKQEGTSTSLTVNSAGLFGGTQIVIETSRFGSGEFYIELLTNPEALDLLTPNMGKLAEALKSALPHITCHLAQPGLLSQFDKGSMLGKKSEKRAKNDRVHEKDRIDYYRL